MEKLLERCTSCKSGSCCQEGVELSREEARRIIALAPEINRPWFRLVHPEDNPAPGYNYETLVKNGRCIFQAPDKKCLVYKVRPKNCAEFPLEDGKIAEYYEKLCSNK